MAFQDDDDDSELFLSRSAKKRNEVAIQKLAEELVALKPGVLAQIPMDDDLRELIESTRNTKTHAAKRRQLRYLARFVADNDVAAIVEALKKVRP